MEMFPKSASIANLFTKFSIVIAQFLLPFFIGWVTGANMDYKTIFIICGILLIIDAILVMFLPFPDENKVTTDISAKHKLHFTSASIAAILIGFTSSTTFMLWLNCNQELGNSYGIKDPSVLQSFYAAGAAIAVLATAQLMRMGLKNTSILILYPSISVVMLALCYLIQAPFILYIGSFVIGYAAAGGVLQLATVTIINFFPFNKGLATSMCMFASSIANYAMLSLAAYITGASSTNAPRLIILLNIIVTLIGIILAVIVRKNKTQRD